MIRLLPFEEIRAVTRVDNYFLNRFMPLAPEGFLKVYLYGLMLCQCGAQNFDLAGALGMREDEVVKAYLYWQAQGLVRLIPGDEPGVEYLPIEPDRKPVAVAQGGYAALFEAMQRCFGSRVLSAAELSKLRDWVEVYGLSEAAVVMMTRHCIESNERGTAISFNYLDAAARSWADMGVKSAEEAESYLQNRSVCKGGAMLVLKRLNKQRPPTQDELALYEKWTRQGFTEEAILLCCTQLTAYGTPSFKALDNVLDNCQSRGMSSEAAIEEYLRKEEQDKAFAALFFSRLGIVRPVARQEREQLYVWRSEWHMPDELILYAADCAHDEAQRFAAARRRLEKWHAQGLNTLEAARAACQSEITAPAKQSAKKNGALNYMQRTSSVNADAFILNLDDDEE